MPEPTLADIAKEVTDMKQAFGMMKESNSTALKTANLIREKSEIQTKQAERIDAAQKIISEKMVTVMQRLENTPANPGDAQGSVSEEEVIRIINDHLVSNGNLGNQIQNYLQNKNLIPKPTKPPKKSSTKKSSIFSAFKKLIILAIFSAFAYLGYQFYDDSREHIIQVKERTPILQITKNLKDSKYVALRKTQNVKAKRIMINNVYHYDFKINNSNFRVKATAVKELD